MRPRQWVWVWMWLLGLGPLESGGKLGRVGRRKAGDQGQCRHPPPSSPEARRPRLGSSLCSPHFSLILPAKHRSSPGGLSQPLRSSGNKIKALHSYTKAVWPGRALGLSQPLGWGAGSAWLFHTLRSVSPAPSLERAKASGRGAESPLFLDRPDFFDYPDSDQAKLLAVAQFIGEKPVIFANSGMTQLEKGLPSWPGPRGWLPLALRLEASPESPVSPSLSSRF